MRLLHTSDWHLGRGLHGEPLLGTQMAALQQLAQVAADEQVDLVIVSGDVYDRALPGVEAVAALDEVLDAFLGTGAQLLVTSGNHDSAQRLGFGRLRSARAGLHLRTGPEHATEPVLVDDEHGTVACFGVGYLEPGLHAGPLQVPRSHEGVLTAVTDRIRATAVDHGWQRVVVSAHAFVAGGAPSLSERDIRVGGVDRCPAGVFDGFDYVALGHLHAPQVLSERVRYSGSPVPYSFSEAGQTKGAWLVDVGAPGSGVQARFVPTPVARPLVVLTGTLEQLLTDPAHAVHEDAYCQLVLTDTERPRAPMERLRRRFPHTLALSFAPEAELPSPSQPVVGRDAAVGDEEICLRFFQEVRGHAASAEERRLIWQALEQSRLDAAG